MVSLPYSLIGEIFWITLILVATFLRKSSDDSYYFAKVIETSAIVRFYLVTTVIINDFKLLLLVSLFLAFVTLKIFLPCIKWTGSKKVEKLYIVVRAAYWMYDSSPMALQLSRKKSVVSY